MNRHRGILLLLMMLLTSTVAGVAQQTAYMEPNDTVHQYNCRFSFGIVRLSPYLMYLNEDVEAWAVIHTNGVPGSLFLYAYSWTYGMPGAGIDSLEVYADSLEIFSSTEFDQQGHSFEINCDSVVIHLRFSRYNNVLWWGSVCRDFYFFWNTQDRAGIDCGDTVWGINIDEVSENSATVRWNNAHLPAWVNCNGHSCLATDSMYTITGLEPNTEYKVSVCDTALCHQPCCRSERSFLTQPGTCIGIPDVTDLHSYYARGYYGYYGDILLPLLTPGIFDFGPQSVYSAHTVHTDTAETDGNTGNQLHTVCPGTTASVRLGNWSNNTTVESMTYRLHVDTTFYSILLLHYAVVLQNPGHQPSEQPRFRLEILDSADNVIDPVCGAVDFVADTSLGWNICQGNVNILWKDWTTMGFDMSAYHGQNVTLRFSTYDCPAGVHFGYAYFNADFIHKNVVSTRCGHFDDNTVTAPDGFLYHWYYQDTNEVVSTERTVTYTSGNGYLHCRLISTENPSCHVTLATYRGPRFPLAIIDTLPAEDFGCDGYCVTFVNRSTVTADGGTPLEYYEPCETALWRFGDGTVSNSYSPRHFYYDSGTYLVTLVAGIGNNQCLDTAHITVTVPDRYVNVDEAVTACDSALWRDSVWYHSDVVGPTWRIHNPHGCDTLVTLDLSILHPPVTVLQTDTFCYSTTYTWHGHTVGQQGDTLQADVHMQLVDRIPTGQVCDSLLVLPLVQLSPDRAPFVVHSDCAGKHYLLSTRSDRPFLRWSSVPHDTCLDNGHDTGHEVMAYPTEPTLYTLVTDWRDTHYCPTTRHITLQPVTFPHAALQVLPGQLGYDNLELTAYDIGTDYDRRRWTMVSHFPEGQHDTVALADSGSVVTYGVMAGIDSLTVILVADNNICFDTIHTTLPMVRQIFYAPNVFTPSADGNSHFVIVGQGVFETELTIYNREGLQVFTTTDIEQGWDGTHDGRPCPQGAYVWHLRYRFDDRWYFSVGTVTLLR